MPFLTPKKLPDDANKLYSVPNDEKAVGDDAEDTFKLKISGFGARVGAKEWTSDIKFAPVNDSGQGNHVVCERLGPDHAWGSEPASDSLPGTKEINEDVGAGNGAGLVRGHLLNHQLGGPGTDDRNLVSIPRKTNTGGMEKLVEAPLKKIVNELHGWVRFEGKASFAPSSTGHEYANKLDFKWHLLKPKASDGMPEPAPDSEVRVTLDVPEPEKRAQADYKYPTHKEYVAHGKGYKKSGKEEIAGALVDLPAPFAHTPQKAPNDVTNPDLEPQQTKAWNVKHAEKGTSKNNSEVLLNYKNSVVPAATSKPEPYELTLGKPPEEEWGRLIVRWMTAARFEDVDLANRMVAILKKPEPGKDAALTAMKDLEANMDTADELEDRIKAHRTIHDKHVLDQRAELETLLDARAPHAKAEFLALFEVQAKDDAMLKAYEKVATKWARKTKRADVEGECGTSSPVRMYLVREDADPAKSKPDLGGFMNEGPDQLERVRKALKAQPATHSCEKAIETLKALESAKGAALLSIIYGVDPEFGDMVKNATNEKMLAMLMSGLESREPTKFVALINALKGDVDFKTHFDAIT